MLIGEPVVRHWFNHEASAAAAAAEATLKVSSLRPNLLGRGLGREEEPHLGACNQDLDRMMNGSLDFTPAADTPFWILYKAPASEPTPGCLGHHATASLEIRYT